MSTIFSRRAFLVSTLGLLGTGTAAVMWLKFSRKAKISSVSLEPYDRMKIDPKRIKSDISSDEIQKAFDVFFNERDRWLHFRGVEADVHAETEITKINDDNKIQLHHDGSILFRSNETKSLFSKEVSRVYNITYSDKHRKIWTFESNRADPKIQFTAGERAEAASPDMLIFMMVAQVDLFSVLINAALHQAIGVWNPYSNPDAKNIPNSYKFKDTRPVIQAPELAFENGLLSEIKFPKRQKDPTQRMQMKQYVESNGFWYPTKIQLDIDGNLDNNQKSVRTSLELTNVKVMTT